MLKLIVVHFIEMNLFSVAIVLGNFIFKLTILINY